MKNPCQRCGKDDPGIALSDYRQIRLDSYPLQRVWTVCPSCLDELVLIILRAMGDRMPVDHVVMRMMHEGPP